MQRGPPTCSVRSVRFIQRAARQFRIALGLLVSVLCIPKTCLHNKDTGGVAFFLPAGAELYASQGFIKQSLTEEVGGGGGVLGG